MAYAIIFPLTCRLIPWYNDTTKGIKKLVQSPAFLQAAILYGVLTGLNKGAFNGAPHLTKIVLPKGLKVLERQSFASTAPDEIILPQGLEIIEVSAFGTAQTGIHSVRSNVSEVIISDSVVSIDTSAFKNRENLKTVVMSKNIEYIGSGVFSGTAWYEAQPEGYICFGDILYEYKGDFPEGSIVTIPSFIKKISERAFEQTKGLKKIIIPEGVILNGDSIFIGCSSLEEAVLPSDLKELPDFTFDSTGLKSITLPDGLEVIGKAALGSNRSLKSITLPDSLKVIGSGALGFLENLKSITLPDGLEIIGSNAFYHSGLTEIVIPDSVTTIDQLAFDNCVDLLSITLGKGLQNIEQDAFKDCVALFEVYNLSSLEITSGSKDNGGVGYYAKDIYDTLSAASKIERASDGYVFYNDDGEYSLIAYDADKKEVVLPEEYKGKSYAIASAFYYKKTLEKVVIPDSITSLPANVFYSCINLKEVVLPDSLTAIPDGAFYGCTSLTTITLGEGITEIGVKAFAVSGVEELRFGDGLKSIGYRAFDVCDDLIYIELGAGLESIGMEAFRSCNSLKSIIIPASVRFIGAKAFNVKIPVNIFYEGSKADLDEVSKGINWMNNAPIYYYTETEPPKNASGTGYDDNYWRYAADNATPVIWQ